MKGSQYRKDPANNFNYRSGRSYAMINKPLLDTPENKDDTHHEQQRYTEVKQKKGRDWYDYAGLFIQFVLAVFTAGVFYQTLLQYEQVKKSTAAAVLASNQAVKANEIGQKSLDLAYKSFLSNEESGRISENLQEKLATAQIGVLDETQKQNASQNEAFLQMSDLKLIRFQINAPLEIDYVLKFSGSQYAKILSSGINWATSGDPKFYPFDKKDAYRVISQPGYVGREGSVISYDSPRPVTKEYLDDINAGGFLFFFGAITYFNNSNKTTMEYKFNMKLDPHKPNIFTVILSENRVLKIKKSQNATNKKRTY